VVTRCLPDVVTGKLLKLVAMNTSPSSSSTAVAPSYYERHIFFCTNQREAGKECCAHQGAAEAFDHCKAQAKALGLLGAGKVRVNKAGCLDRCAGGRSLWCTRKQFGTRMWTRQISMKSLRLTSRMGRS
jgi:hypothetical protein